MRIGTNHGSLSDRILSKYGDTPLGMVESAMEFLRICRDEDYHEVILSMKASNTRVMVQAYRLLVAEMIREKMNYPLHLGVTEELALPEPTEVKKLMTQMEALLVVIEPKSSRKAKK